MPRVFPLLTVLLVSMVAVNPCFAKKKGGGGKGKGKAPAVHAERDKISSVSAQFISVVHEKMNYAGKKTSITPITYTYTITKFTTVEIDGKRSTVADLKRGMRVTVAASGAPGSEPPPAAGSITATRAFSI